MLEKECSMPFLGSNICCTGWEAAGVTSCPQSKVNSSVLLFTSRVARFPHSLRGGRVFGMENETAARGLVQPLKLCSFQYIVITLSHNNANIWFSLPWHYILQFILIWSGCNAAITTLHSHSSIAVSQFLCLLRLANMKSAILTLSHPTVKRGVEEDSFW